VNVSALRELAESLPPGSALPVPREWLLQIIGHRKQRKQLRPLPSAHLADELTQKEAADLLRVSVSYLRASSCPKHLLPGNGKKGKDLVRYRRDEVLAWGAARPQAPAKVRAS
jgi:hypothetical protein